MMDDDLLICRINKNAVRKNKECQKAVLSLSALRDFLDCFDDLSFERNFVFSGGSVFSLQRISTSLVLTMNSIVFCCESYSIADANTLLRKYRDDIFFYLYVSLYSSERALGYNQKAVSDMKKNIEIWLDNSLKNLNINVILKAIAASPSLEEAVKTYKLESTFKEIGMRLNNFVHSNGYRFYNKNANNYGCEELSSQMQQVADDANYITVSFLFLLILCNPLAVMATDYVDSLEYGKTPPEGSQYWIAPFVEEYIKKNISAVHKNCLEYLKNNTCMTI